MSRRRRAPLAALGVILATTSLTACADETDRYCDELTEQRKTLSDLASRSGEPGEDVLDDTLQVWRGLRDEAPGDIEDEWTTLVYALEGLVEAFRAAGTTPAEYDPASPPPGVSDAEARNLEDAAAALVSERVTAAGDSVEQHARDVCKVDLGISSQGG